MEHALPMAPPRRFDPSTPRGVRELSRPECLRLLGRGGIGRVALSLAAMPAVFPVAYAMLGDDVVFRTGPGTKLTAALNGAIVAFEIDRADLLFHSGWSVVVVGPAHLITDAREAASAAALPLASWAPSEDDMFVRIGTKRMTGRAIHQAGPTS